ncbi:ROK family protein [Corynebacterium tapiri]|uniref:ROK family protein n=1 Tax=Corynebacterium tapiri TaxID=1448266 RepID=UPI0015D6055E|nr:ROK family protein [Corynebacterium tapiri]
MARFALHGKRFTASDVMKSVGLTRATALAVCGDLLNAGWIREVVPLGGNRVGGETVAAKPRRRGRPAQEYQLASFAVAVIGIEAGQHHLTGLVCDLTGEVRVRRWQELSEDDDRLERIRQFRAELMGECPAHARVLCVLGVPAPVGEDGLSPGEPDSFWQVMNPRLGEELDGDVLVFNDANLAAEAEAAAAGDSTDVVALIAGERLGAGVIVDGRLLLGPRGGAGEMRFLTDYFGDEEAHDGMRRLIRKWAQTEIEAGRATELAAGCTAEEVIAACQRGDEVADEIVQRVAVRLARIGNVFGSLLGAMDVAVVGSAVEIAEVVVERARVELDSRANGPVPTLRVSHLGRDIVAKGAVAAGMRHVRENPLYFLG